MADGKEKKEVAKVKGFRFSNMVTDKAKENEGVWIDYESGFRVKIARLGSRRFKEFMVKASKPHMRKLQSGSMDNDTADDMMRKALSKTILIDWEGLLDDNDQPIPFSQENALKCLTESDDFYRDILALAQERDIFQNEENEAAQGNL